MVVITTAFIQHSTLCNKGITFPVSGASRKSYSISADFNRRFGIGQFLNYLIAFKMDQVDAAPCFRLSLKAAFQRRPIEAPSVKYFSISLRDSMLPFVLTM
jgi:hypothetical protein